MNLLAGTLGRIYYWVKDGRKGGFVEEVILKKSNSQDQLNKNYYAGLIIIYILVAIIVFLSYIF